jgi:hypothetical protein
VPTKLITKYSTAAGNTPAVNELEVAELAVNVIDKQLYTKNNSDEIVRLTNRAELVSVKDYGAKCDGTTDDTTAIQACLTGAPEGSYVYFPSTCLISNELTVTRKLTLQGTGTGKATLKKSASFPDVPALTIGDGTNGLSGVSLFDFFINGNKAAGAQGSGLRLQKLGSFNLTNFRCTNNKRWGMLRDGLWLSTMTNVSLVDNGTAPVYTRTGAGTGGDPYVYTVDSSAPNNGQAFGGGVKDTFVTRETSDLTVINFNSNRNSNTQMLWDNATSAVNRMVAYYQLGGEYGTNDAEEFTLPLTDSGGSAVPQSPVVRLRCADRSGFIGVRFNSATDTYVNDLQVGSTVGTFSDIENLTFSSCHTQKTHSSSDAFFGVDLKDNITSVFFTNQDHRGTDKFMDMTDLTSGIVSISGCETIPLTDIVDPNGLVSGTHIPNSVIRTGSGSPNGNVSASIGSLYLRTDSNAEGNLYTKTSTTGNTGWTPLTN